MKQKLLSIAIIFGALMLMSAGTVKVHTCGDSTMAPYDESATVTRGWGMYFQQFLNGVTSVNYARGGRDTRGFYEEADRWGAVKKNMQPGDYVIIQFAHNDEKNGGMDGHALKAYYESIGNTAEAAKVDLRGSVPTTTYKEYLRKYVEETRALGGNPILVAPVCRSYFSGGKIKRNGRHDLGDSFSVLTASGPVSGQSVPESDHSMDYPYQMKMVAEEMNVPFIDLTTATAELYESYGDAKCHEYLFDGEGSTHFNTTGALLVARKCAELMKAQGILADNIVLPTDLTVTPSDGEIDDNPDRYIDFGLKANVGTELKITNISLYVGGAGGNGMMCHVYYSTDNYQTRTTIYAPSKMVSNTMNGVSNQPVITLKEGEEVHVRVYPWYNGAASGKTICLSDVTIEGMAFGASSTAISNIDNASDVVSVTYYDAAGRELHSATNGMNIVRTVYANGTTTIHKTINN